MGNKQSHNFSKSKSVSLSNIPYKWDNISYNSKKKRPSSIASNSPKEPSKSILRNNNKLSNTKRTSSLGSLSDTSKRKSAPAPQPTKQNASPTKPVQPQRSVSVNQPAPPPAQRQSSTTNLRQYNDAHLQSDIKKLFKAHDKSNSKAMIEDEQEETMTAQSLDRRLETLKRQRNKDTVDTKQPEVSANVTVNTTLPRKSKKEKKAPSLPPIKHVSSAPQMPSQPTTNGVKPRPASNLKKKAAPAPPPPSQKAAVKPEVPKPEVKTETMVITSVAEIDTPQQAADKTETVVIVAPVKLTAPEDTNNNNNSNGNIPASLHEESLIEPAVEQAVESAAKMEVKPEPVPVPVAAIAGASSNPNEVNQSPSKDPLSANLSTSQKEPVTVIERELQSTSTLQRKQKKAPHAPPTTPAIPAQLIISNLPSDTELEVNSNDDESFIAAVTHKAVDEDIKVEQKEIAIQYDAPVDMAIQCDGTTLKEQSQKENKEKLGSILKLFIDKKAEEDAKRNPHDKSPDSEEIIGAEERFEFSIQDEFVESNQTTENNKPEKLPNKTVLVQSHDPLTPTKDIDVVAGADLEINVDTSTEVVEVEKQNSSPTNSNDSGHDEPSMLSSSITTGGSGSHSPVTQSTAFPLLSPSAPVPFPSAAGLNDNHGAQSPKTKKQKNRYSGIYRITKTMRSFMSSIGKSSSKTPSPSEEIESKDEEGEDGAFAGDNWVLSKGDRPAVVRKEYHPTISADTFQAPEASASTAQNKGQADDGVVISDAISLSSHEGDDDVQVTEDLQVNAVISASLDTETVEAKAEDEPVVNTEIKDEPPVPEIETAITTKPAKPESETFIIDKAEISFDLSKVQPQVAASETDKPQVTVEASSENETLPESSQTIVNEEPIDSLEERDVECVNNKPDESQLEEKSVEEDESSTKANNIYIKDAKADNKDLQPEVTSDAIKLPEVNDEVHVGDGAKKESGDKVNESTEKEDKKSDDKSDGALPDSETEIKETTPEEAAVVMRKHKEPDVDTNNKPTSSISSSTSELNKSPARMSWSTLQKRNSGIALMSPKGYGVTPSTYRPMRLSVTNLNDTSESKPST